MATKEIERLCMSDVLARGWTRGLVQKYLGRPDATRQGRNNTVLLYDEARVTSIECLDEFRADINRIRKRRTCEPVECDLLSATFAINRAAKRWRDAARSRYGAGSHALATHAKEHKEYLYALKEKGIATAYMTQRLAPERIHGGLCLYRGGGYSFHSRLTPNGVEIPASDDESAIFVEAKPKGVREPLQRDAIATLRSLPEVELSQFTLLERPAMPKPKRTLVCWTCGEEGHLSRECPHDEDDDDFFDDDGSW